MNSREPTVIIATFYKFVRVLDTQALRDELYDKCKRAGIKGTIIIAKEGINGTVAGSRKAIDSLLACFRGDERFRDMEHKESLASHIPFHRLKIKSKQEIVTMGQPDIDPRLKVGTHVNSRMWNELVNDPDVLVIDTRNDYECTVGTFKNAVSPNTRSFREFPDYVKKNLDPDKNKKIAMFCTGGIRCEKATSYLLSQGFDEVYHLKGGILKYLEEISPENNLWQGECFVFDGRVSINEKLEKGKHVMCYACRMPLSEGELKSDKYEEGISCPYCCDDLTEEKRQRLKERQYQVKLAEARNDVHIGKVMED